MVKFATLLLPVALFASTANGQFFGGGESSYPRLKLGGPLGSLIGGGGGGGGSSSGNVGFGQVLSSLLQGQTAAQSQSPLQQLATAASNTYIAAIRNAMPGFANLMGSASAQQPVQYAMPPMGMHGPHGPHNHPHHHPSPMAFPGGFGPGPAGPGMSFLNSDNSFFPGHIGGFDGNPFAGSGSMNAFNAENFNFGPQFGGYGGPSQAHHGGGPNTFGSNNLQHNHGPSASLYGGQFGRDSGNGMNNSPNQYNGVANNNNNGPRDNNFDRK